ncbi:MAG: hypothetical protein KUF82_06525 [Candidatus Thiodiazotropha sp. (ex Ctena orbiculata)]|nr:hypothetical protein [Candidatus Thiodiazotropha taylori]
MATAIPGGEQRRTGGEHEVGAACCDRQQYENARRRHLGAGGFGCRVEQDRQRQQG